MRTASVILAAALASASAVLLADGALGDSPKGLEMVYSPVSTNLAWDISQIEVRDGQLFDPTGTFTSKADLEYLVAVSQGITNVLTAGENAFREAKAVFYSTLSNHPFSAARFVSMVFPAHGDLDPADMNPYGMIVREKGLDLNFYFNKPFLLKPTVIAETVTLADSGASVTNYDTVAWVDYMNDATNNPARPVGAYPTTIRATDPPVPAGVRTVIRDGHVHYGHPRTGMQWGGMSLALATPTGLLYAVTGVHTVRVDGVAREWRFKNGAWLKEAE